MAYKYFLLALFAFCCCLSAGAQDSISMQKIEEISISDKRTGDFGRLYKVDGMKVTVGKKTEVVQVAELTANKSTNNARQVYAKVSGINIFENDGSGLTLSIGGRGLDPNRTANFNVRQNGYDISADALGYPESYYTPPTEALSRIEMVKGAASLQFGTQFGGLLNFRMKQPGGSRPIAAELRQTGGSRGYFSSFNSIQGTIGRISYFAYGAYKRGNGWRPNSKYQAFNAYADLHYRLSENSFVGIEFSHLHYLMQQPGGLDDRMFAEDPMQSNRKRNWFAVNWNLLNLEWETRFSPRTKWEHKLYGLIASRDAIGYRPSRPSQADPGGPRDLLKGNFKNLTFESRLLHHYSILGKRQTLLTGLRLYHGYNQSRQGYVHNGSGADFDFKDEAAEVFNDYSFPNWNAALFAEHIFRINPKWSVSPGLRWEFIATRATGYYHDKIYDLRDSIISDRVHQEDRNLPRQFLIAALGSSYTLAPHTELYGNWSQNYRSVTFNDIRVANPSFEVDSAIRDERGWSADAGIRGELAYLQYDISVFYLHYGNRIGEYFYGKPNGQVIRRRGNVGEAKVYGVESLIQVDLLRLAGRLPGDFSLSLFSNLSYTRSRYTQTPIPNILGKSVEYVPVWNWKAGLQARYKALFIACQTSYLSDQFTDATNAREGGVYAVNGLVPAFMLMDLSARYTWSRFSVEASMNNLANCSYFTRRATGYPGPGIIPGDGRSVYLTLGIHL